MRLRGLLERVDLPELTSILFGTDACAFDSFLIVPFSDSCLIVRGGEEKRK